MKIYLTPVLENGGCAATNSADRLKMSGEVISEITKPLRGDEEVWCVCVRAL